MDHRFYTHDSSIYINLKLIPIMKKVCNTPKHRPLILPFSSFRFQFEILLFN